MEGTGSIAADMDINIAFCFDHNLIRQVQVVVASLLDHTRDERTHYHIYCICTKEASPVEEKLRRIIESRDRKSELTMKALDNPFRNAYEVRGISTGTYLRLGLPGLLPDVDRILYTDVDILFRDSLAELWQTPMEGKFLAAVRGGANLSEQWEMNSRRPYWHHLEGMRGNYINAGVTLMNLEEIRAQDLQSRWQEWTKEKLYYQDQDILNITCQGRIAYLPLKYNCLAYMTAEDYDKCIQEGVHSVPECEEARHSPVIIHYAGDKPWKRYDTNFGEVWWKYVNSQSDLNGLFDEETARRYHGPTLWDRGLRKIRKILENH